MRLRVHRGRPVWVCLCHRAASFTYFEEVLRCPHKRIVTITKVYIARNKHTRGSNTIPYKLARLVTFESFKWKYSFTTIVLIVYEIRLIAIREVSPPFREERASTAVEQEISFPANKKRRQLCNSESL